jgi:hypothetical protein
MKLNGGLTYPVENLSNILISNNPSLELWDYGTSFVNPTSDATQLANNWKIFWVEGSMPCTVSREGTVKTDGSYSAKILMGSGVTATSWGFYTTVENPTSYIGKSMILSADCYCSVANKAGIGVTAYSNRSSIIRGGLVNQANTWQRLSVPFVMPNDSVTFQVLFGGFNPKDGEIYYVDNVKLVDTTNMVAVSIPGGSILQEVYRVSYDVASGDVSTFTEVMSGWRLGIKPKSANSKLILDASFCLNFGGSYLGNIRQFQFYNITNGIPVGVGFAGYGSNRNLVSISIRGAGYDSNDPGFIRMQAIIDAVNTNAREYTILWKRESLTSAVTYFSYSSGDYSDFGFTSPFIFKITEVAQ